MLIQLLLLFITHTLAKVHHECGVAVTRPIFSYNGIKKPPIINVYLFRYYDFDFGEGDLNITISQEEPKKEVLPLLIYREEDRKLTNIPDDFDKVDSWGSFGICTEEDINSNICSKLNSFKVEYKDEDVSKRIYNDIYVEDQNRYYDGDINHINGIKLERFGRYCYDYYLTEEQEFDEDKDKNMHTYVSIDNYSVFESISNTQTSYYGRFIQLVFNICLLLFIWFKKSKNIKEAVKQNGTHYQTPFIYCFIMLVISSITSIIHLLLIRIDLAAYLVPYEQQSYLQKNQWELVEYLMIFESLFSLILYICAYQFANLDKFGYKINYRKNKFTMILPFFVLLTFLIHYFVLNYRYSLVDLVYRERHTPHIMYDIVEYGSKAIELFGFAAIWYIIYKISQKASKEITHRPDYANRFNNTRIWVVFVIIFMGIIKIAFDETLYILVFNITEFIQSKYGYEEPSGLLSSFVFFCLKFVLCLLHEFMLFSLPVISIIILKIWWSYDPKLDEDSSIELRGL